MAEIELSVLGGQCLDRRIEQMATIEKEVAQWEKQRNSEQVKIRWAFTVSEARVKLSKIYPTIEN